MSKIKESLTREVVEQARKALSGLPETPASGGVTVKEAILDLRREISKLKKSNYTTAEIAKHLSESGINVTATSLSRYLGSTKTRTTREGGEIKTGSQENAVE